MDQPPLHVLSIVPLWSRRGPSRAIRAFEWSHSFHRGVTSWLTASPKKALSISFLVLHGSITLAFHSPATWVISSLSLFRPSVFFIYMYTLGFSMCSVSCPYQLPFSKDDSVCAQTGRKSVLFIPGAATCLQPPELSCYTWFGVNCRTGYGGTEFQSHLPEQFVSFGPLLASSVYLQ